jgi:hypothetical protein
MYANGDDSRQFAVAFRAFTGGSLAISQRLLLAMENSLVAPGGRVGFAVRTGNATNSVDQYNTDARFEFFFSGGSNTYEIIDGSGRWNTSIPFTTNGLQFNLRLSSADTYDLRVVTLGPGGATNIFTGQTLGGTSGTGLDSLVMYCRDTESGGDAFFNSLEIEQPGQLTVVGLTGDNKGYDRTTAATARGTPSLDGLAAGDDVTLIGTPVFTFASSDVGTGIEITTTEFSLGGADAGDYTLLQPVLSADISAKPLTIPGLTAHDKLFDGTTTATVTGSTELAGIISPDEVTLGGSPVYAFVDPYVANDIEITVTGFVLGGADAGNYSLTFSGLNADIAPNGLTALPAYDDASDPAYADNWQTGDNGGSGLGPWTLMTGVSAGHFIATAGPLNNATLNYIQSGENSNAWGLWANGDEYSMAVAYRPFTRSSLAVSQALQLSMENSQVAEGGYVGFVVRHGNATNSEADYNTGLRFEFLYNGGSNNYEIVDGGGRWDTGIPMTTNGLRITLILSSPDTYDLRVVTLGPAGTTNIFSDKPLAGTPGAGLDSLAIYNGFSNVGGFDGDLYFNGLKIYQPKLTVTGLAGDDKVYDGTTAATASGTAVLEGVFADDDVTLQGTPTFTFASAGAGEDIEIITTGYTLGGADAEDYSLIPPALIADIAAKELTTEGPVADNKTYDGTTDATISGAVLVGVVDGDDVSLDALVGTFAQATVGTFIEVTTALTLTGADAGNYDLTQPAGLWADIAAKELTTAGAVADNKTYDGTQDATISGAALVGVVDGDDVSLGALVGTFVQAGVGTDIVVIAALTLAGADAGNYALTQPADLSADIAAKELTTAGAVADNKTYDGTTDATISGAALVGVLDGDDVWLYARVGTFAQADVGTDIAVTAALTLAGADAGNYDLTQPADLWADIAAMELTTAGAVADNKTYDGTTDATISGAALVGVLDGDAVLLDALVGTFAQATVGTGIEVTAALTLAGDDAGNYDLTQPADLWADIAAKELMTAGAVADNKTYDGTTDATISGAALVGVVDGDDVSLDARVGTFAQADVGMNIAVTAALTLAGDEAGNYDLTQPADLSADIAAKALAVTGLTGDDKVYDGTTAATASGTAELTGVVTPDEVTLEGTPVFTFAAADVSADIAIAAAGYSLGGADAGNYSLTPPVLIADITSKALAITAMDITKGYLLTYSFTGNEFTSRGLIGDDEVTSVDLRSDGAGTAAEVGDYDIIISHAQGTGLENYTITYFAGTLSVQMPQEDIVLAADGSENFEFKVPTGYTVFAVEFATFDVLPNQEFDWQLANKDSDYFIDLEDTVRIPIGARDELVIRIRLCASNP